MKATLLFRLREVSEDGAILEMRLWQVAEPVPPATHRFKYALFYGRPGQRLVLFDNERGKGDHRHIREVETAYAFTTPEQLIADFLAAVRAVRSGGEG